VPRWLQAAAAAQQAPLSSEGPLCTAELHRPPRYLHLHLCDLGYSPLPAHLLLPLCVSALCPLPSGSWQLLVSLWSLVWLISTGGAVTRHGLPRADPHAERRMQWPRAAPSTTHDLPSVADQHTERQAQWPR
jgi:hypothetical protein